MVAPTGLRRLVVAGGVFANVKLNQHLHELDEVKACSSPGTWVTVACHWAPSVRCRIGAEATARFLGEAYTDDQIAAAAGKAGLPEYMVDPERTVAQQLPGPVGRFHGAMEWGRALGNRSILVRAVDPRITGRLNKMLSRSDFMPFAPPFRPRTPTSIARA